MSRSVTDSQGDGVVKVYSPDIKPFSLEGKSGLFSTIASFLVGPVRLLLRVMHNIMILPADLLSDYANGLILVSGIFGAVGLLDLLIFRRWPLLVSQIVTAALGLYWRQKAEHAVVVAMEKNEVDIDTAQVNDLCNEIIGELDELVGKE